MQRSSNTLLIAIIGLAVFALVFANVALNRVRPKTSAELTQEAAEEQAKKAQENPSQKPPEVPGALAGGMEDLVALAPETTFGPGDGKPVVTVGFHWTPEVQADPQKIQGAVALLRQGAPRARIRVVNLDLPEATRVPEGIAIDTQSVSPLDKDGGLGREAVTRAISQLIGHAPPPEMVGGTRPGMPGGMPPGIRLPGGPPGGMPGMPGGPPLPQPPAGR